MERKDFVRFLGINAFGAAVSPALLASNTNRDNTDLTVNDLNNYLRSLYKVGENSVDQIIIGDPNAKVTKIGTCWMPYWRTLKKAVAQGVNTMIVHEPTFYSHFDLKHIEEDFKKYPETSKRLYLEQVAEKKKWIEENKLSIIRCHDVLDIIPAFGIPYAFGMALGFSNEDIVKSKPYYNVYRIEPTTVKEVASHIASKLSEFGQSGVALYGDENRIVKSVGLGTGCICDPIDFMELEAGLSIAIDDSVRTWTQTYYAEDTGNPLIIVNHGTSEENGLRMLNAHLKEVFKTLEVIHFNQGCGYRWIS
jgi:putative NIF3 family GTP cyclohydrolase 1 type 2